MNKLITLISILVTLVCLTGFSSAPVNYTLKTSEGTITIDQKAMMKIVLNNSQLIQVNSPVTKLWRIILRDVVNNREYNLTQHKAANKNNYIHKICYKNKILERNSINNEKVPEISMAGNVINIKPKVSVDNKSVPIEIIFTLSDVNILARA